MRRLKEFYDQVAREYAERFVGELADKPLDRGLLDGFAALVGGGRVLDVGTGPGQIAAYLAQRGVDVEGVDLSPAMIAQARERFPELAFRVGDMLALADIDASIAGMTAFYAIVHLTPDQVEAAAREWARVLAPGGRVLVSFHVGTERVHVDEFLGHAVDVDFQFHPREQVEVALERAGLAIEARLERRGDAAVEHPSLRAYLLARKNPVDGSV